MLTYLASPKPFRGIAKDHQYRAIQSWLNSGDDVEVILYGDSPGVEDAGRELGVKVVTDIGCAPSGIPYFGAIADHAAKHARHDMQMYLNCDILLRGAPQAMRRITFERFLLIGQRIDLAEGLCVDVCETGWTDRLNHLDQAGQVRVHAASGMDYFGFRRGMWEHLPPVIIGRAGYDNALIAFCLKHRIPIIDTTKVIAALHQFHDYGHIAGGRKSVWTGEDAQSNFTRALGSHSQTTVADAEYVLEGDGIRRWKCRGDRLRAAELWLRHKMGFSSAGLSVRVLWRVMRAIGVIRVREVDVAQLLPGYSLLNHRRPTLKN